MPRRHPTSPSNALRLLTALTLAFAGVVTAGEEAAEPLRVWDITFNDQAVGGIPKPRTKAVLEREQADPMAALPMRTYSSLEFITASRRAVVTKEAAGLTDQPLLFTYTENSQPHYGPRMWLSVPAGLAESGKHWHLSFDVAKGNVAISGGVLLRDVAGIVFHEDGTVRAGKAGTEIARYRPGKPLHIECTIDVPSKEVSITVDGRSERAVTMPWDTPRAAHFRYVTLDGLLPGGHAESPGSIAFDNIRLVMKR